MNDQTKLDRRMWLKTAGAGVAGLVMIRQLSAQPAAAMSPAPQTAPALPRPLRTDRRRVQGVDIYPA